MDLNNKNGMQCRQVFVTLKKWIRVTQLPVGTVYEHYKLPFWDDILYEAGMAPPIGGVDKGGNRRAFSFADMAAISGSWVSYIFTNLANFRTPVKIKNCRLSSAPTFGLCFWWQEYYSE